MLDQLPDGDALGSTESHATTGPRHLGVLLKAGDAIRQHHRYVFALQKHRGGEFRVETRIDGLHNFTPDGIG